MRLTTNFELWEFDCKSGAEMPCDVQVQVMKLAVNLQVLRDYLNTPIDINSGYRTAEYNATIPNSGTKSKHILGQAADIVITGYTAAEVHAAIEHLIAEGRMHNGGLGKYNTFTHYDVRPNPARWDFSDDAVPTLF